MNEIKTWIDDPKRDYSAGVALLARYSKNKSLVNHFAKGSPRFWMSKLVYELRKIAPKAGIEKPERRKKQAEPAKKPAAPKWMVDVIDSAKKEIASLYSAIDKLHSALYDLGTSNDDEVVKARAKILERRKPLIERADRMYTLKEDYFSADDKNRAAIAEELKRYISESAAQKETVKRVEETATKAASLSDIDLVKRRAVLRTAITKTKNMLDFQSIRTGSGPSPMPDGPKRKEYEAKLKQVIAEEEKRRGVWNILERLILYCCHRSRNCRAGY